MPSPEPVRVLCYSPYNAWGTIHASWEITVLQGLKQRGADLHYVLCDGLFSDCDLFWEAISPRPANACSWCQATTTQVVHAGGLDFEWLGRYLMPEENREARRWAAALSRDELPDATYGSFPVADWVRGSVHSHLRRSDLDVADPKVEASYRSYLFSGLVACFALDRLLDESRPDVMLQFNGRQSSTRVAFELARRRGIRVITHERGVRNETLGFQENGTCTSLAGVRAAWSEWADVPLAADELAAIDGHLTEREHGVNMAWSAFTTAPAEEAEFRAALDLDADRPVWALFTSSDDEVAAESHWLGGWDSQLDWIRATIDYAGRNPGIDLVIRVHPNTGSRRSHGVNHKQLEQFERLRAGGFPANVRMIDAGTELSSYTLMNIATVGLVWQSTVALEIACKGKATVAAAGSWVTGTDVAHTADDPDGYAGLLDRLRELPAGAVSAEVRRRALRLAYTIFFRIPIAFPLVRMPGPLSAQRTWTSPEELAPGRDAAVDRCGRIILDGEAVCLPPAADERERSTAAEEEFLGLAEPARKFVALAYAEELIEDGALLSAWAARFSATDPATLVIKTPAEATELLVETVTRAGLDADGTADLLAVDSLGEVPHVDAVFSRRQPDTTLVDVPRFDDGSFSALLERVESVLADTG